jgi:hypothetical protein
VRDHGGKPDMPATRCAVAVVLVLGAAGGICAALLTAPTALFNGSRPVWIETAWPSAVDHWGRGLAFRCTAAACGSEIDVVLRAKFGFCGCASTIDDAEVDRIADFDLVGGDFAALDVGRPIVVHGMEGRARRYAMSGRGGNERSAIAVALHDRCDMVVATAVTTGGDLSAREDAVIELLKTPKVRRWAEVTLGL